MIRLRAEALDLLLDARLGAGADRHHGDDRRHADDDAEHGERGAQLVDARAPAQRELRRARRRLMPLTVWRQRRAARGASSASGPARRSTSWPSRKRRMRARVARDVRLVRDQHDRDALRRLSAWKSAMISTLVRVSSAPVGSSARISDRLVDQRARDRHALLLAARELAGMVVARARRARPPPAFAWPRARRSLAGDARRRAAAAPRSPARWCAAAG